LLYALDNWKVDKSKWSTAEKDKFAEAEAQLRQFGKLRDFVKQTSAFRYEFFVVYTELMREIQTATLFNASEVSVLTYYGGIIESSGY
jgi:hypothetical protein